MKSVQHVVRLQQQLSQSSTHRSFSIFSSSPLPSPSFAAPINQTNFQLHTQRRHASTTRRHRKLLNLPPAQNLTDSAPRPTGSSGRSRTAKTPIPIGDHLIFNPPPSIPNVYHTPLKFLPKGDRRRQLHEKELALQTAPRSPTSRQALGPPITGNTTWPADVQLPPVVGKSYDKKYHLTAEDFEEMRRLRRSDEETWTRTALARKFDCSQFLVGLVVQASEEKVQMHLLRQAAAAQSLGPRARKAREERIKRREMVMRDE